MKAYEHFVVSDAQILVDRLKADPAMRSSPAYAGIAIYALIKDLPAQLPAYRALRDSAHAIGIDVIPGWNLMADCPFKGWVDAARWAKWGDWVRLIRPEMLPGMDLVIFDSEAYQCTSPKASYLADIIHAGWTRAQFDAAHAPFLQAIRDTGIIPGLTPANSDDLMTEEIAKLGNGIFWVQDGFHWPEQCRIAPDAADKTALILARNRTSYESKWPQTKGRVGSYVDDDIIKKIGLAGRARLVDLGNLPPLLLMRTQHLDTAAVGTAAWLDLTSRSSTNDMNQVWVAQPYASTAIASPGGVPMLPTSIASVTTRKDIRSDQGFLITNGVALRASDVMPHPTGDWTDVFEFILPPTGKGPVAGGNQRNYECFQLVIDDAGNLVLEVRHSSAPLKSSVVVQANVPRGVPIRMYLAQKGQTFFYPGGSWTPSRPMNPQAGHLWIGAGTDMGTYNQTFFEGLCYRNGEHYLRALSAAEGLAVLAKAYPR